MKKLSEKGRRVLRRIYSGLGAAAVSFLLPACPEYGMPPDMGDDVTIHGSVKSQKTNAPIPGIKVSVEDTSFEYQTSSEGSFYIYVPRQDYYTLKFEDVDGPENGGLFKAHEITLYASESSLSVLLEEDDE